MICISCKNIAIEKYSDNSYFNLPVYQCKTCNLFFTGNYEEHIKNVADIYNSKYWIDRNAQQSIQSDFTDADSLGKKRNWISQYAYCRPFLKNKKKILDVGSGAGQSLFWFEKAGFDVVGIEPDKNNVELINKKLERGRCIVGYFEDLQLEDKFEIIWLSHVLEHLIRPDLFLQKIKKNLSHDGIFFIEVPNCENKTMLKKSISEPHMFHFSKSSLFYLIEREGFAIQCCDYFRPATVIEGALNKAIKKCMEDSTIFPYYPRILTDYKKGRDLRLILSL